MPSEEPKQSPAARVRGATLHVLRRRPVSFYLLLALFVVAMLTLQLVWVRDDPRRFALVLALVFIACFVIIWRAVVEIGEVWRKGLRAEREAWKETLGDPEFTGQLRESLKDKDWDEMDSD
jgi:predicted lysophospholipase L1 biosynthesis ABC-type transport system permease subunit